ncbi:UDP-N-acetylglucosamine 2-epimerase (non-hydrolyzing) [candidate division WOR-3 bacterium]|nr:UDP-N-acetylglucosamine 2-epimerase (non-hydrolyzing) [candidate division WOR-3 bacterium]
MKKNIAIISGTRPNIVKIAPLLKRHTNSFSDIFSVELFHTGQHYDFSMHGAFFEDFSLPPPEHVFEVKDLKVSAQIGTIMVKLERAFEKKRPDLAIVVGDVNSTLAAAITSSKMGITIAHLEAGVRSFDMTMPEEQNRVVVDSLSDILLSPTKTAVENLKNQGKDISSIKYVGNILAEALYFVNGKKSARENFGLMTLHRPFNVDNSKNLESLITALGEKLKFPIIFPAHPRTLKNLSKIKLPPGIKVEQPMAYSEFISALSRCSFVITDSGGIQTEATILKTPCVTLRKNSEWPETVDYGTNVLLEDPSLICYAVETAVEKTKKATHPYLWDKDVSLRIWNEISVYLNIDLID